MGQARSRSFLLRPRRETRSARRKESRRLPEGIFAPTASFLSLSWPPIKCLECVFGAWTPLRQTPPPKTLRVSFLRPLRVSRREPVFQRIILVRSAFGTGVVAEGTSGQAVRGPVKGRRLPPTARGGGIGENGPRRLSVPFGMRPGSCIRTGKASGAGGPRHRFVNAFLRTIW